MLRWAVLLASLFCRWGLRISCCLDCFYWLGKQHGAPRVHQQPGRFPMEISIYNEFQVGGNQFRFYFQVEMVQKVKPRDVCICFFSPFGTLNFETIPGRKISRDSTPCHSMKKSGWAVGHSLLVHDVCDRAEFALCVGRLCCAKAKGAFGLADTPDVAFQKHPHETWNISLSFSQCMGQRWSKPSLSFSVTCLLKTMPTIKCLM